jgi:hypothetical protein
VPRERQESSNIEIGLFDSAASICKKGLYVMRFVRVATVRGAQHALLLRLETRQMSERATFRAKMRGL